MKAKAESEATAKQQAIVIVALPHVASDLQ